MTFNKNISGYENEEEFVKYLNHARINELHPIMADLLYQLYGEIEDDKMIYAMVNYDKQKGDIIIYINHIRKLISIKKGYKNSVHMEGIGSFTDFLKEQHISQKLVNYYLYYHFGDGTRNGTGHTRLSAREYKKLHQPKINELNLELNKPELVKAAINRFVLQGRNSDELIDAIIYGVVEDFVWITREDIEKIILSKRHIYSTGVHFANLSCQPLSRGLSENFKNHKERYCVQIKWFNLGDNIIEVMNQHVMNQRISK